MYMHTVAKPMHQTNAVTLVRNDQKSFSLHDFHINILPVLLMYVKFQSLLNYKNVLTL